MLFRSRMLSFKTPNSDVNLRQFLAQGWDLVDSIGSVMLFRRHLPILQAPYTVITQRNGGKDKIKFAQFHDLLDLVQFSVDLQSDDKFRIIKLTYGFFVLKPVEFDMSIFVQLVDEKGNYVYSDYWKACRGIYPANRWVPGEEVGETYNMLLPSKVPPGRYKLSMALVDPLTRRTMAVRYANESGDQKHLYYSEWVNVH